MSRDNYVRFKYNPKHDGCTFHYSENLIPTSSFNWRHKPVKKDEKERIINSHYLIWNGGYLYQCPCGANIKAVGFYYGDDGGPDPTFRKNNPNQGREYELLCPNESLYCTLTEEDHLCYDVLT